MKKHQILLFVLLFPLILLAQKNWSPEQVLKIKNVSFWWLIITVDSRSFCSLQGCEYPKLKIGNYFLILNF